MGSKITYLPRMTSPFTLVSPLNRIFTPNIPRSTPEVTYLPQNYLPNLPAVYPKMTFTPKEPLKSCPDLPPINPPNDRPFYPWIYSDFSGGLGLISVVLISAILAGSGCHVLKKDTQENINELNKFITNLKGTVQK